MRWIGHNRHGRKKKSLSHQIEHLGRPLTEPEMHVDAPSEANIVNDEWMENRDREREK